MSFYDEMWGRICAPPDRRPIWEWAEHHIRAIPYSPNPGAFRVENSPQIKEIFEAITDPRVRLVSIIAAVQASKTTVSEIALAYVIANMPGPTLWLNETDEDAKDQSESRLQKLFDVCEPVRALYPANRHQKRNTTIHFANGMTLWMAGAHNRTNLQRRSIRWLFGDETWQWPVGHMAEAEARVTAFGWLGKCIFSSQGGVEDDDTHRKFETTDMREWTFACPHCGHRQPFKWENVEWSKDCKDENEQYDFTRVNESTSLRCEGCNTYLPDSDESRRRLNATGKFVPQNSKAAKENVGFHWNAIATMPWGKLAELYLRAKIAARRGDTSLLQQFYQKRLALPWREYVEDFKIEITKSGYRMGEPWDEEGGVDQRGNVIAQPLPQTGGIIPLRFLTVDVQMDHFFAVVRSWTPEGSSRLLWCEQIGTWEDIDQLQERFSIHQSLVFIDANYNSFEVYRQCSHRGWTALIGDPRATFGHRAASGRKVERFYSSRNRVAVGRNRGCFVHRFSNLNVKDCLARLRRNQDPSLGPTWEVPDDVPEEYLAHLEAEHRVKKGTRWIWEQIGSRPNHYLDCETMQTCGALMLKLVGRESRTDGTEVDETIKPRGEV
jgi:phage terminase large subunit GpA-like protein